MGSWADACSRASERSMACHDDECCEEASSGSSCKKLDIVGGWYEGVDGTKTCSTTHENDVKDLEVLLVVMVSFCLCCACTCAGVCCCRLKSRRLDAEGKLRFMAEERELPKDADSGEATIFPPQAATMGKQNW